MREESWARTSFRPVLLGAAVGALWIAAFLVAVVIRAVFGQRLPVTSLTAALMIASIPLARRAGDWAGVPRASVVTALSLPVMTPFLMMAASYAMSDPLVSTHWRCGTGDVVFILTPIPMFVAGWLGVLLALFAAKERRLLDASIRVLKWAATGVAAALVIGSVTRFVRYADVDRYVESMPIVGSVPGADGPPTAEIPGVKGGPPEQIYDVEMSGITVRRICTETCSVILGRENETDLDHLFSVRRDAKVIVRHDPISDVWIVQSESGGALPFKGKRFIVESLTIADVARSAAPPAGWILGGVLALAIAIGLDFKRRAASRDLAALASARDGTLGENGWITFDGGDPSFRAPPDIAARVGPVTVISDRSNAGVYRDGSTSCSIISSGDRLELMAAARGRIAGVDALSLASLIVLSAPLVSAALRGLVF